MNMLCPGADPGFEKEGAQRIRGLVPKFFLANLGDFLKNLAQKRVGVSWREPPAPPPPLDQTFTLFIFIEDETIEKFGYIKMYTGLWDRDWTKRGVGQGLYRHRVGIIHLTIYSLGNNKLFPLLWWSG